MPASLHEDTDAEETFEDAAESTPLASSAQTPSSTNGNSSPSVPSDYFPHQPNGAAASPANNNEAARVPEEDDDDNSPPATPTTKSKKNKRKKSKANLRAQAQRAAAAATPPSEDQVELASPVVVPAPQQTEGQATAEDDEDAASTPPLSREASAFNSPPETPTAEDDNTLARNPAFDAPSPPSIPSPEPSPPLAVEDEEPLDQHNMPTDLSPVYSPEPTTTSTSNSHRRVDSHASELGDTVSPLLPSSGSSSNTSASPTIPIHSSSIPRHFSLSSEPEVPSPTSPASSSSPHNIPPPLPPRRTSDFSAPLVESPDASEVGLEDVELGNGVTTPGGSGGGGPPSVANNPSRRGTGGHRRARSEASLGSGSGEAKYGFIRGRVETQNTIYETDPAAKRASVEASSKIRENFEKLQLANRVAEGGEDPSIDWAFWGRVMSNYEEVASTQPRELSRAIQKGIPPALRGMCWQLMAATKDPQLEQMYQDLLKQTSPHEKSIGRDLNRTFPKHEYFRDSEGAGQENLFNVVKAYSLYDEEVGYTQGLQFIVGPLLLNMPDEEAFCVLVRLMKSYDLRSHYTPNMPGLQLRLFQFDRLLEELLPAVFLHLLRQGIKSSMYASQWFLTLFGYRFPLELVSSVFDLVFAEGVEAIFRFAIAILKRSEDKIVQLEFEDLAEFLKNGLFEAYAPEGQSEDGEERLYKADEFVREALQVKITPIMLDQFGEEWDSLCRAQAAHTAELDQLRKANSHLSAQVRQLETSLSQVNEEHCELVKQVVMAKLEREELEDELVKYKIAYAEISHQQLERASGSSVSALGASSSPFDLQQAQDREDRLSRGSSNMSRGSGSQGL